MTPSAPARALLVVGLLLLLPAAVPTTAQTPLLTLESPFPGTGGVFGSAVAAVADLDGDGLPEVLVGAPYEYEGGVLFGRAYVFSAGGALLHTLGSPNPESGGLFGSSVAAVPDVDGDGYEDLLIGAPGEPVGAAARAGRVYLFSGASGALLRTFVSGYAEPDGYFGRAVAGLPDVDFDGRGDVVVGASHEDAVAVFSGRVHVISGTTGTAFYTIISPNAAQSGFFGIALSGVPDVDGDGYEDLLIGAYGETVNGQTFAGRAYLFSTANAVLRGTFESPNPEYMGIFGTAVSDVPDADGDGKSDLLVGAPYEEAGGDRAGHAYLFSSADGTLLHALVSPGAEENGRFGSAVSGVPDADGDGRGDLLVGTFEAESGLFSAGRAYLFSGDTGALLHPLASPDPNAYGYFGGAVAGVPDLDGDGRGDLIVGALGEGDVPLSAGRVYLFSSPAPPPDPPLTLTLTPTDPPPPVVLTRGQRLRYRADFTTAPDGPASAEYWAEVTLPNGAVRFLFGPNPVALVPGGTVTLNFQQRVPGNVPFGDYVLTMCAGTYPDDVLDCDDLPATVVPGAEVAAGGGPDEGWVASDGEGWVLGGADASAAADASAETVLLTPAPNPSSGRVALRFGLAEAGRVRLAVYDALGREVAVLVDGVREAGSHDVPFDASALAPGTYVVRLLAGGSLEARRFTLTR
jgi:hypothetical protein